MKITPITLTQFNKDFGNDPVASLYVLNRSNPNGNIAFNCINELNVTIPVLIPATFIPIDLTTMAPLENLLRSSTLRQILSKKQLVILRPEDAEKYLSTPRAKAEYQRINKIVDSVIEEDAGEEEIDLDSGETTSKSRKKAKKQKKSPNNHFIEAMIDRASDDEDDESLQREFMTRAHSLTFDDLERLRGSIKSGPLTELILEAIQDRMNEEEEEEEDDE